MKKKPRVLIVDDEESLCSSIASILSESGFPCTSAQAPSEALQSISQNGYEIAILDINMPEMDGISLAKEIRRRMPDIGIILISGYGTFDNAVEAIKTGVYDFIKKPFKANDLLLSVKRLAKLLRLERDLACRTEELRKSEERYRTLIENTADGIALVQKDRIVYHNKALDTMLGYEYAALTKPKLSDLIHAEDYEKALAHAYTENSPPQIRYRLKRKDGHPCWTSVSATRIEYQGKPTLLASFRNITPLVEAENMRIDMERMLRHDMRSQVIGVVGLVNRLIERTLLTDAQAEYCRLIRKCGMDLEEMIENYLDASRLEQGPIVLKKEDFNLLEIVKHARDALREFADRKNVAITIIFDHKVYSIEDGLSYHGDRMYLQNAFNNLLKNALEASPQDTGVKIKIRQKPNHIEASIHNWSTIPEEIRENFFDKYVSAGKRDGTGLGTYMARLVVEGHAGTISFQSSKNEGTTVIMELPLEV